MVGTARVVVLAPAHVAALHRSDDSYPLIPRRELLHTWLPSPQKEAKLITATLAMLTFLIGLLLGRWYHRILATLAVIHTETKKRTHPEPPKPAVDTTPGVIPPPKPTKIPEPIDLSEETGGVLPLSPTAVAFENDRARKAQR